MAAIAMRIRPCGPEANRLLIFYLSFRLLILIRLPCLTDVNYGTRFRLASRNSRITRTPVAILSSRPFFPYATLARVGLPETPLPSPVRPAANLSRRTPSG